MSLSAALLLAAAAAAPVQYAESARATAQILPAAIVRQASGFQQGGDAAPRHQLSRRGNTIQVEFQ